MKQFIKDNHLSFGEGRRNSTVTVLIGYAQHLGLSQNDLEVELSDEIEADSFIQEEIDRLWNYCKKNNYKTFWKTAKAKAQYKF